MDVFLTFSDVLMWSAFNPKGVAIVQNEVLLVDYDSFWPENCYCDSPGKLLRFALKFCILGFAIEASRIRRDCRTRLTSEFVTELF
jgi:hypothetical protein